MRKSPLTPLIVLLGALFLVAPERVRAQADAASAGTAPTEAIAELETALAEAGDASSTARQRLAVRRAIRDAEELLESRADSPDRFVILEFLFRARQQLVALDDDTEYRQALLETSRKLVEAPDEFAELRLEADLLLSQAKLAKEGANAETRAEALRPFIARYVDTPVGPKVARLAMVMALELGDSRLVTDIREIIKERFAADLDMIAFQRDKLAGQVFGAPFCGTFERVDGKRVRFPMDGLGRSTMCLFWSKENGGIETVNALAAAELEKRDELDGRLEIVSFNVDELPDAGESIIRAAGVDWQVLRLPGGRENKVYKTYVRSDPRRVTVSPTGQAAMIMTGALRKRANSDGTPDYARMFQSTLARQWTQPRYVMHLSSLMAGDFLVLDPINGLDPARPPELKGAAPGETNPLPRGPNAVPGERLQAIDECFVRPPQRYRLTHAEARSFYSRAVDLCRKTIADYPQAPDLWIVRNRLMVALLGLWKTDADLARFDEAVAEARIAMAADSPPGCDIVARLCLAREAFRAGDADPGAIIDSMIAESGGSSASGPALAAAALLSLDVADRRRFENYRQAILEQHVDHPMMWTFSSFLLDRYHDYWLFQVPFTAGWSYGRRESYFTSRGDPDQVNRRLEAELRTIDGETLRIPQDTAGKWTILAFLPQPEDENKSPFAPLSRSTWPFVENRPLNDVRLVAVTLGSDVDSIRGAIGEQPPEFPIAVVPDGGMNPMAARLGILSEDVSPNVAVLKPDGTIASTVSGLVRSKQRSHIPQHVIEWHDERAVSELLEQGNLDRAKELIFTLAPPFDPEAVDERGRKLKKPRYSLAHLRARARVYMALNEWDKALADAEEVVDRQMGTDGGMSLRTDELDRSEALREEILRQRSRTAGP